MGVNGIGAGYPAWRDNADFGAGCVPCIGGIRGTQCEACL